MNCRGRNNPCRNLVRPEFDQLDARLLLSVTAATGSASNAAVTLSGPSLTAAQVGATSPAPPAPPLTTLQPGDTQPEIAAGAITLTAKPSSATRINLTWTQLFTANEYLINEWIGGSWEQVGKSSAASSGCTIGGLSPGTTYSFKVGAVTLSPAATIWSGAQSATTFGSPPAFPVAPWLEAAVISSTQVSLSWSGGSGVEGFFVYKKVSGDWTEVASLDNSSTSYTVTGLSPNTEYTFIVGAYNGAGTAWSNEQNATTYQQTTIKSSYAWSGYVTVSGGPITAVGATWVQPTVSSTGTNSRTGFWVGMDGWSNGTVEQIGTAWNTSVGYWAWVEFYGDGIQNAQGQWTAQGRFFNPVPINSLIGSNYFTIEPGDVISGSVTYVSSTSTTSTFEFRFQDARPGSPTKFWQDDLTTQFIVPARSTAEWIVESPAGATNPLAAFSPVNFFGAWVSTGDSPQPITALPNYQVNLVPGVAGGTDYTSGLTTSNTPGPWQYTGQSSAFNVVFGSANGSAQLAPSTGATSFAANRIKIPATTTIAAATVSTAGTSTPIAQAIEELIAVLPRNASLKRTANSNWPGVSVADG
jgi:hypothetical protein